MRTTQTMTISLPPRMVEEFEKVRKAENRTRSELVREALRTYFSLVHRFPEIPASQTKLAAIRRGRQAFARRGHTSVEELFHDLESGRQPARKKKPPKASRKRLATD